MGNCRCWAGGAQDRVGPRSIPYGLSEFTHQRLANHAIPGTGGVPVGRRRTWVPRVCLDERRGRCSAAGYGPAVCPVPGIVVRGDRSQYKNRRCRPAGSSSAALADPDLAHPREVVLDADRARELPSLDLEDVDLRLDALEATDGGRRDRAAQPTDLRGQRTGRCARARQPRPDQRQARVTRRLRAAHLLGLLAEVGRLVQVEAHRRRAELAAKMISTRRIALRWT